MDKTADTEITKQTFELFDLKIGQELTEFSILTIGFLLADALCECVKDPHDIFILNPSINVSLSDKTYACA